MIVSGSRCFHFEGRVISLFYFKFLSISYLEKKENMEEKEKTLRFVKHHNCLLRLFNSDETIFILSMVEIQYLEDNKYFAPRGRNEVMKFMGMKKHVFDKCVKRMVELELLEKTNNQRGNKVYYFFNLALYDRLLEVLSATNDIDAVLDFCNEKFKKERRSIASITDEEIKKLRLDGFDSERYYEMLRRKKQLKKESAEENDF